MRSALYQSAWTSTGLPSSRRHDPIADLGVHPRQRNARRSRAQEAVVVHANAVPRAAIVPRHGVREHRQQLIENERLVAAGLEIAVRRDEEPERRIDGVVVATSPSSGMRLGTMPRSTDRAQDTQDLLGVVAGARS